MIFQRLNTSYLSSKIVTAYAINMRITFSVLFFLQQYIDYICLQ